MSVRTLASVSVFAGIHAHFPAKDLREVTRARIAHFQADIDDRVVRLPQQSPCLLHAQTREVLGWREAGALLECPREMRFAQVGLARESAQVELIVQSRLHGRE